MKYKRDFEVEVKRTNRRKTATLKIHEGMVQAIVPQKLSQQVIDDLIQKKTDWIRKKLIIQQSVPTYKPKEFVSGGFFSYLGRNYRLKVLTGDRQQAKLKHGYLEVTVKPNQKSDQSLIRKLLQNWYITHATEKLEQKTETYAQEIGVRPSRIKVKEFKSRWGSCSSNGEIIYNWKIIMSPDPIVDYVVVHELCHLVHQDHSKQYWHKVRSIIPDYQSKRDWLKVNSSLLEW